MIEILVVILLIGVLVGLLVPAVVRAREAGYRTSSANNQRQIALAFVQHNDTLGFLPNSYRDQTQTPPPPRQGLIVQVLPYLDRQDLYDKYNPRLDWFDNSTTPHSNLTVTKTKLSVLINPAAPRPDRLDGRPDVPFSLGNAWGIVGVTDYAVITHIDPQLPVGPAGTGLIDKIGTTIIPKNVKSRLSDVRDGLGHTILLTDSAARPYLFVRGQQIGDPYSSSNPVRVNGGGWSRNANDISLQAWTLSQNTDGSFTANRVTTVPTAGTKVYAINATNGEDYIPFGEQPTSGWTSVPNYVKTAGVSVGSAGTNGTGSIYSFHAGGANFAFADGRVQFISENIDLRVLVRLLTRDQGEIVDDAAL